MHIIKNILVPIDFSKCAANAMNFALEIAVRTDAHIHVLHVVYQNEHIGDGEFSGLWFDEYVESRSKDLVKWIGRFRKNSAFKDIKITTTCTTGFPISMIKALAGDKKADLIVMGTTGATGVRELFIGSNAAGVMSSVKIPVLAIPEKTDFLKHANYVFATDYGISMDKHSWNALKEILKIQHSSVHILHVLTKPEEQPNQSAENQIRQHLEDVNCEFKYLHGNSVQDTVNAYIEATNATGLVTVSHQHSFIYKLIFQSNSKNLVQRSRTPILVLHDR